MGRETAIDLAVAWPQKERALSLINDGGARNAHHPFYPHFALLVSRNTVANMLCARFRRRMVIEQVALMVGYHFRQFFKAGDEAVGIDAAFFPSSRMSSHPLCFPAAAKTGH